MGTSSQAQDASLSVIRGDPLFCADAADLIDRGKHREYELPSSFRSIAFLQDGGRNRKPRGTPAAISPGSPKSHNFLFENSDLKSGIRAEQVVSCPKPRISSAKNGNVYREGALKGRPGSEAISCGFEPEAIFCVIFQVAVLDKAI
jgi:hypothetical protein